jgi:hypothetical protein
LIVIVSLLLYRLADCNRIIHAYPNSPLCIALTALVAAGADCSPSRLDHDAKELWLAFPLIEVHFSLPDTTGLPFCFTAVLKAEQSIEKRVLSILPSAIRRLLEIAASPVDLSVPGGFMPVVRTTESILLSIISSLFFFFFQSTLHMHDRFTL